MIMKSIAHDVPKNVPRVPSISGIDLLAYGNRCRIALLSNHDALALNMISFFITLNFISPDQANILHMGIHRVDLEFQSLRIVSKYQ